MPGAIKQPDAAEIQRRRVSLHGRTSSASTDSPEKVVGINAETVTNVTATDFPHHYIGEDNSWSLEKFRDVSAVFIS